MSFDVMMRCGSALLRCGYTTGTCAALASAAAARLLLTGVRPAVVSLKTPGGIPVEVEPQSWGVGEESVRCAVQKQAGDDPDVTDGILIFAEVQKTPSGITVDGGEGIGRVTKPGLDQSVGAAAINRVPRQMIADALKAVCEEAGYAGGLSVVISAPGGEELARKTFNPMLGIEGGISVLGTSGIVEPMSEQALVDTIAVQARQFAAQGRKRVILAPGNYALDFLRSSLPALAGVPLLKCSNYIGDALDIAALERFEEVLLVGHIGKLVKLAGGVMNTHSRMADCRMELLCAHAACCGAEPPLCRELLLQPTTDACLALLQEHALLDAVMQSLLRSVQHHLDRRASGAFPVGAVLFSNVHGLLGCTETAKTLLEKWRVSP